MHVDTEQMRRAAGTMYDAAETMKRAASAMEDAVDRLEKLLGSGYGNVMERFVIALEENNERAKNHE